MDKNTDATTTPNDPSTTSTDRIVMKLRIQFVITGLAAHGAEMMLYKLLSRINRDVFNPEVISLMDFGTLGEKFQEIDIPVKILGMRRGVPDPLRIYRLMKIIRQSNPHLVQTWMYHADLIGGLAAKSAGKIPVVWNIRNSNLEPGSSKKTTIITAKTCAWLSKYLPVKIVCCAETARKIHENIGYEPSKMKFIPNGFDLKLFKPDSRARMEVCQELNIPQDSIIIGMVARFDPQKDQKSFVQAAKALKATQPNVHFVLCGDEITHENKELSTWIDDAGLLNSFHLLGRRTDIPRLTASFDIASLSSAYGEAFSNSIGEAMACGAPCCVTAVGDAALIVGDTGRVVPVRSPEALSNAWRELIDMGRENRQQLGRLARQRVLQNFSLDPIVKQYEKLYWNLLGPNV